MKTGSDKQPIDYKGADDLMVLVNNEGDPLKKLLTFKENDLLIITIVRNKYITNEIFYPDFKKLESDGKLK